jgi:cytochrome oxidase assembly protein ShyY1
MGWIYLVAAILSVIFTIYFQVKGMRQEAILCLFTLFVSALMLGLRNWQQKRMDKLEKFLQEKEKNQAKRN